MFCSAGSFKNTEVVLRHVLCARVFHAPLTAELDAAQRR